MLKDLEQNQGNLEQRHVHLTQENIHLQHVRDNARQRVLEIQLDRQIFKRYEYKITTGN